MEPEDLLRIVVAVCEEQGLRYLVTGSTATIAYGEPRFTNDIDIVYSETEFNQSRMARSRALPVLEDRSVQFASPEDVILMKLKYFKEGGSEKHLRDIRGVLTVQSDKIDRQYITAWAKRLGLTKEWIAAQSDT